MWHVGDRLNEMGGFLTPFMPSGRWHPLPPPPPPPPPPAPWPGQFVLPSEKLDDDEEVLVMFHKVTK